MRHMHLATIGLAALCVASQAQAQGQIAPTFQFDIPANTLDISLQQVATVTGGKVELPESDAATVHVAALKGKFTLEVAIERLLQGTEWYIADIGAGQIRVARLRGNASDIIVTAPRTKFMLSESSLLTRTDTPLRQTPGTIESVTQDVLQSRNATDLADALRNLPGVSFNGATSPAQARIRGETTEGVNFTNGLRGSTLIGNAPTIDVETIEVLKGPSSILTGTQVAGGVLNLVPKRALGTSPNEISLGIGSGEQLRATADIGGTLSESNRLYWRLVSHSEYADHRIGAGNSPHTRVVTGIMGYRDNGWKIDASLQYLDDHAVLNDFGYLDAAGNVVSYGALINRDANIESESVKGTASVEKDLVTTSGFSLRLRARGLYQSATQTAQIQTLRTFFGSFLNINVGSYQKDKAYSGMVDLYSKFSTGPVDHQVIVAFDYAGRNYGEANALNFGFASGTALPLIATPSTADPRSKGNTDQYGLVMQDQMNWGRLHLLGSLRQTWYRDVLRAVPVATSVPAIIDKNKLLPSGGVVFDVTHFSSAYFSYQKAFKPANQQLRQVNGTGLPPSVRSQYEIGLKTGFFGEKFVINADYFQYSTDSSALIDPNNPNIFIVGPGQRAHGAELSFRGAVTDTFKVLGGFTYTVVKDEDGISTTGNPRYQGNLWLLKSFPTGPDQSLDVGAGGNYSSNFYYQDLFGKYYRYDRANLSIDGAIGYRLKGIKANLTVDNILNRHNVSPFGLDFSIPLSTPRRIRFVLTTTF